VQVKEFELLAKAQVFPLVRIVTSYSGGFEVVGWGDNLPVPVQMVERSRGGVRVWATLDSAYSFVRGAGYEGRVEVD
jgi:hypothetical protein